MFQWTENKAALTVAGICSTSDRVMHRYRRTTPSMIALR